MRTATAVNVTGCDFCPLQSILRQMDHCAIIETCVNPADAAPPVMIQNKNLTGNAAVGRFTVHFDEVRR